MNVAGYVFAGLIALTLAGALVVAVPTFPDSRRNVKIRRTSLP